MTLGKGSFVVKFFVETALASVALGKPFAESFWSFEGSSSTLGPCLVPKNFAKFFRFPVTSNL